jgi:hypothetical protein
MMMNKLMPVVEVLNCARKRATMASTFSIASKTRKTEIMRIEYLE